MTATLTPALETLGDLYQRFGPIPLERIRFSPPPGLATEDDLLEIYAAEKRLCELVDGVLVEKAMGYKESVIAMRLGAMLLAFVDARDLGIIAGEGGMLRLRLGLVRIPDVSFISWERIPGGELGPEPIAPLIPDLAVEVLSESNTRQEMGAKLDDYFSAGVRLVWHVDPRKRTVEVFTARDTRKVLHERELLDGGEVLPGFAVPLANLFRKRKGHN